MSFTKIADDVALVGIEGVVGAEKFFPGFSGFGKTSTTIIFIKMLIKKFLNFLGLEGHIIHYMRIKYLKNVQNVVQKLVCL